MCCTHVQYKCVQHSNAGECQHLLANIFMYTCIFSSIFGKPFPSRWTFQLQKNKISIYMYIRFKTCLTDGCSFTLYMPLVTSFEIWSLKSHCSSKSSDILFVYRYGIPTQFLYIPKVPETWVNHCIYSVGLWSRFDKLAVYYCGLKPAPYKRPTSSR